MDSDSGSFDLLRPRVVATNSGLDVVSFMDLADGYGLDAPQLSPAIRERLGAQVVLIYYHKMPVSRFFVHYQKPGNGHLMIKTTPHLYI